MNLWLSLRSEHKSLIDNLTLNNASHEGVVEKKQTSSGLAHKKFGCRWCQTQQRSSSVMYIRAHFLFFPKTAWPYGECISSPSGSVKSSRSSSWPKKLDAVLLASWLMPHWTGRFCNIVWILLEFSRENETLSLKIKYGGQVSVTDSKIYPLTHFFSSLVRLCIVKHMQRYYSATFHWVCICARTCVSAVYLSVHTLVSLPMSLPLL